jgi:hypothetical protein
MTNLFATPRRSARRPDRDTCRHQPRCPHALAPDRLAAQATASHPEQGWSLLCNGIVLFDDAGALLPDGRALPPAPTHHVPAAARAA